MFHRVNSWEIEIILFWCNDDKPYSYKCLEKFSFYIWRNVLCGHAGLCRLSVLNSLPHSRIVNPCYGGTIHSMLEPMTGMLLRRSSWRLYHWIASKRSDVYSCDSLILKCYYNSLDFTFIHPLVRFFFLLYVLIPILYGNRYPKTIWLPYLLYSKKFGCLSCWLNISCSTNAITNGQLQNTVSPCYNSPNPRLSLSNSSTIKFLFHSDKCVVVWPSSSIKP